MAERYLLFAFNCSADITIFYYLSLNYIATTEGKKTALA
jgi:hypothetical protein